MYQGEENFTMEQILVNHYKKEDYAFVQIILDSEGLKKQDLMVIFAKENYKEGVEKLLADDPAMNINHVDKQSFTAIQWAVFHVNIEFTRFLIENGAEVVLNARNDAYSLAQERKNDKMIELLNEVHIFKKVIKDMNNNDLKNIDDQNKDGKTPLHLALEYKQWDVFGMLLGSGARIDPKIPELMAKNPNVSKEDIAFVENLIEAQKPDSRYKDAIMSGQVQALPEEKPSTTVDRPNKRAGEPISRRSLCL